MAQHTIVKLVDDLDGGPADETVNFSLDGKHYEIDLSADHAKALRENFADFVDHARKAPRPGVAAPAQRATPTRADREETQAIREWAQANGHEINGRGRIPKKIVEAYQSAH